MSIARRRRTPVAQEVFEAGGVYEGPVWFILTDMGRMPADWNTTWISVGAPLPMDTLPALDLVAL